MGRTPAEHGIDALRAEDAYSSKLGYEEHMPGQMLPRRTLAERLVRECAIFKINGSSSCYYY